MNFGKCRHSLTKDQLKVSLSLLVDAFVLQPGTVTSGFEVQKMIKTQRDNNCVNHGDKEATQIKAH